MNRNGSDGLRVGVVSGSGHFTDALAAELRSSDVAVKTYAAHDAVLRSTASMRLDMLVVDDRACASSQYQVMALREKLPRAQYLHLRAPNEERCAALLGWGADDAVVDLAPTRHARLVAAMRRARALRAHERASLGDIVLEHSTRRVLCAGAEIRVTPNEFAVLEFILQRAPIPVDVDRIAQHVWGRSEAQNKRSLVQTYASYLRRKLAASTLVLKNSREDGYYFAAR